jgi:MFS family permease
VTRTDLARPGAGTQAGLRQVLSALCLTQITSWGILYYAFAVLSEPITKDTGWSRTAVTAAFSGALLVSATAGIPVGRWLDRHGPRGVMTSASVLGVVALVAVALSPTLSWFTLAWLTVGAAMAGVLYPPAFAALTRWYGPRRLRALTILTLVAGLASTLFAPLTAALADPLGWRGTYLVLAGVLAVITVPVHWLGLRRPWPPPDPHRHGDELPTRTVRSRAFLALVVALTLAACAEFAALVNLVPLLRERGSGTGTAALVLGLSGAGQLLGRLGYARLARYLGDRERTVLILVLVAITTAAQGLLTSLLWLSLAAILAGTVRGTFTLLQATAVTDRWGASHYGRLNGLLSAPVTVTAALAPWIGVALADVFDGYAPMFLVMGALGAVAAICALASVPAQEPRSG